MVNELSATTLLKGDPPTAHALKDGTVGYVMVGELSIMAYDPRLLDELADAAREAASLLYAAQAEQLIAQDPA